MTLEQQLRTLVFLTLRMSLSTGFVELIINAKRFPWHFVVKRTHTSPRCFKKIHEERDNSKKFEKFVNSICMTSSCIDGGLNPSYLNFLKTGKLQILLYIIRSCNHCRTGVIVVPASGET